MVTNPGLELVGELAHTNLVLLQRSRRREKTTRMRRDVPSTHPDNNSVASVKRQWSYWARLSVRRTHFGVRSLPWSGAQHRSVAPLLSRHDAADGVTESHHEHGHWHCRDLHLYLYLY